MSNEQFLILLHQYRIRLERIYRDIDDDLPGDCRRYKERVYIGSFIIPFLDKDSNNWIERESGRAIILEDLHDFINELGNAEDILKIGLPAQIQQEAEK